MGWSLVYGEVASGLRYLVVVTGMLATGFVLTRLRAAERVENNEALVITALAFVAVPVVMVYPIMGYGIDFTDALFETVSAITTTGLTTVTAIEGRENSFLFVRAWMQWYGGLGIVVLSVALLVGPGAAARRLARVGAEQDLISGTRLHARRVLSVYVILTLIGIMALWMSGLDWHTSLLHALAGISTGGFSTFDRNIAGFADWTSQLVLMILALAGAVSLALYHPAYYRTWRELTGHLELKGLVTTSLVVIGCLMFCMLVASAYRGLPILEHAPLMALSAQTGAGFSTLAVETLDPASKLVLIVSMFIGGGVGSTAGGIKILRLLILLRLLQLLVQRACMATHAVAVPSIAGHRLGSREIEHALLVILWFAVVILLSWFAFLVYGYAPLDSLFDVVSATATVGLSSGVTSTDLPILLKLVLCLDMLLGRLEVVALLLVLYPRTWMGRRLD